MKVNFLVLMAMIVMSANIQAGWFDKIVSGNGSITDKIDSAKEAIVSTSTVDNLKSALSNEDITAGLKQALSNGAGYAVASLGKGGGFMDNAAVKIPMPGKLDKIESLLRKTGNDKYADEFVTTMNQAAEAAVPLTLDIIKNSVADMSIEDAKVILNGPDDAATQYLKKSGSDKLITQISPIIKEATSKAGVTNVYKKMYGKLGFAGKFLNLEDYNVDDYVTQKTTDGLFTIIAQEEKKIRDDPAARTTDILKNVFGSK